MHAFYVLFGLKKMCGTLLKGACLHDTFFYYLHCTLAHCLIELPELQGCQKHMLSNLKGSWVIKIYLEYLIIHK